MASIKLITPQSKPPYFKLTANVTVDGKPERRYSRFEFDPKVLRTAKSRASAAMAAAVDFERAEQEAIDLAGRGGAKSFYEVAQEHIADSKARLEPAARLRGDFDHRKNKANTTRDKANYLAKLVSVCPWFCQKPVSEITKKDCMKLIDEIEIAGVRHLERAYLLEDAQELKTVSFNKMAEGRNISAYTIAEAFRGQPICRRSAEEIAAALNAPLHRVFRIERTERSLARKTLREYALFVRQVLRYASDQYEILHPDFDLPSKGSRPRFVDCLHEDEVEAVMKTLSSCSMTEQAVVMMLLNTGVRRGELAGLTWQDINFKECTIHVNKSLLVLKEYGYQLTTTKESNDRYVDTAPEFMEFMKRYQAYWTSQRKFMGASWQKQIDNKRSKNLASLQSLAGYDFIICDDHGWPLNPDSYASIVHRVGEKAGVRHLHPHMFRHTFVSLLLSNPDIGVATVAAEAGHAQPSTTLMIYTQQYKKRQQSIRDQLSREIFRK